MNAKAEKHESPSAAVLGKYVLVALLAIAGMVGYYWFSSWPTSLRVLPPLFGVLGAGLLFAFTPKGKVAREYLEEARFELRKVIWPTREETIRTTIMVVIVVVVVSALLGVIDVILSGALRMLLRI